MSVYVELVLFNNFAVDLFISLSTIFLRRKRIKKARLIFASAIGAVIATAYAVVPDRARIAIKILLAPLFALVAFKTDGTCKKDRTIDYLITLVCFCLVTYLVGGVVYGLSYAFKVNLNSYATLGLVALSLAVCIAFAHALSKKRSESGKRVSEVTLFAGGKQITLKGLCDSGNLLVDDFSGLPVMILSKSACKKIEAKRLEGYVSIKTVSGEKCLPLASFDCVRVDQRSCNALGAMSDCSFGDYDIILQNSMF